MPDRRDETPTSPETAAQLERLNARIRRRSSQAIETARVHASLVLVDLGLPHDDRYEERELNQFRLFLQLQ